MPTEWIVFLATISGLVMFGIWVLVSWNVRAFLSGIIFIGAWVFAVWFAGQGW